MKKLQKLNDKQIALMEIVKKEWINLLDSCPRPNREAVTSGVKWLYNFCKLKEPLVIIVQSPLGAQIAANMLKGAQVWAQVLDQVGDQVRAQVWDQVRAQVWAQVRAQVRAQVGDQVWDQVLDQVRAQVRAQVRDQVWDQVGAQVWAQVGDQVWDQVRAQVGAQVRAQVRDQVGDQVGDQVWDQVWAQEALEYFYFSSYGSVSDFGWLSFYDFFERIGIKHKVEGFATFRTLMQSGVYDMIQLDGACIVVEMPTEVHREERGRLHNTEAPAIMFGDGYEMYALWGVRFSKESFISITKNASAKQVVRIENMEQRMAALKLIGPEKILKELDSKLIHEEDGYQLYGIDNLTQRKEYALKYSCPSTQREYISFVKPEVGEKHDAIEAIASKWNLNRKQWMEIGAHS